MTRTLHAGAGLKSVFPALCFAQPLVGLMNVPVLDLTLVLSGFWLGCCALLGRAGNALRATWPGKQIVGLFKSC